MDERCKQYHSALSRCAELLDNMKDGDPITEVPDFLAKKLKQCQLAGAARQGGGTIGTLDRWTGHEIKDEPSLAFVEFVKLSDAAHLASQSQAAQPSIEGLTRYDGYCSYDGGGPAEMEVSEDGEYVKYSDVAAHLAGQSQATRARCIDLMNDLMRFECVLTPEGKAEMYASETGPYVWLDHVLSTLAAPTAQEVTQQAAPTVRAEVVQRFADYSQIAHLIGSIFFAGDFKAETASERELEALLIKTGHRYASWEEIENFRADDLPAEFLTQQAAKAGAGSGPTYMGNKQASEWAWDQVKRDVGTDGWTAGDSFNYFGFFLHGWGYGRQYERQGTTAPVVLAAKAETAERAKPVARLQIEVSDRPFSEGEEYYGIVILDRARCADGMELFAPTTSTVSAPTRTVTNPDGSTTTYISEYENDLEADLAAIRDLFPMPDSGELHNLWSEACSEPRAVVAYVKAQVGTVSAPEEVRQCVRDAVAGALSGLYYCGRVWSAWGVGTMSQDDFTPADEDDDILDNVVNAVFEALRTTSGKGETE